LQQDERGGHEQYPLGRRLPSYSACGLALPGMSARLGVRGTHAGVGVHPWHGGTVAMLLRGRAQLPKKQSLTLTLPCGVTLPRGTVTPATVSSQRPSRQTAPRKSRVTETPRSGGPASPLCILFRDWQGAI